MVFYFILTLHFNSLPQCRKLKNAYFCPKMWFKIPLNNSKWSEVRQKEEEKRPLKKLLFDPHMSQSEICFVQNSSTHWYVQTTLTRENSFSNRNRNIFYFYMQHIIFLATHLSNQLYSICFRRNVGKCTLCFHSSLNVIIATVTMQVNFHFC